MLYIRIDYMNKSVATYRATGESSGELTCDPAVLAWKSPFPSLFRTLVLVTEIYLLWNLRSWFV